MSARNLGEGPPVRLLPVTIAVLACVLAVKSAALVRAAPRPGPNGPAAPASAGPGAASSARAAPAPAPGPAAPAAPAAPSSEPARSAPPPQASAQPAPASSGTMPAPPGGADPIGSGPPPDAAEGERSVLADLKAEREALERKARTVASRESMLGVAEARLTARVGELQALQTRLEGLESARREHDEANWRGLVKTYEAMRPRDAASIMNELDGDVLLQVLDRMKEAKAAPVLAAMDPARARAATARLAELRTRGATLAEH